MIDLRAYFPKEATVTLANKWGGASARYDFRHNHPGYEPLYRLFLNVQRPGAHCVWAKHYMIDGAWRNQTNAVLFMGDDKSVIEVGDWTVSTTPYKCDTVFGYRDDAGKPVGLVWSPPGGLEIGAVHTAEMNCWRQKTPGTAYKDNGSDAYSRGGLIEHLPRYTPPYGRRGGRWGAGYGKEYQDVVHLVMYHGTRSPGWEPVRCTPPLVADGVYYQPYKDFNSYAIELYMARGVGIIQQSTPFVEAGKYFGCADCSGNIFSDDPHAWMIFIDKGAAA